jgi:hypothetical protein
MLRTNIVGTTNPPGSGAQRCAQAGEREHRIDSTAGTASCAIGEFCARYGICRDTFYSEVKRGRLRALKLGKKTIVLKDHAESWAKSLPALRLVSAAAGPLPSRG